MKREYKVKISIANATEDKKAKAHTILFHWKTFQPSSIPIGIRFKTAMEALKNAVNKATWKKELYWGKRSVSANEPTQKIMFVKGPATAVFPTESLLAVPAIITAPGEIILKNGETIDKSVMRAPKRVNRNSAHNP